MSNNIEIDNQTQIIQLPDGGYKIIKKPKRKSKGFVSLETRQKIAEKTNCRCCYCGKPLYDKFLVSKKYVILRKYKLVNGKKIYEPYKKEDVKDLYASCYECNQKKKENSLEEFRTLIFNRRKLFIENSRRYGLLIHFGLVSYTEGPIVFYFETLKKEGNEQ